MSRSRRIEAARARRRETAEETTPAELAAMVCDDLETKRVEADELFVIAIKHEPGDTKSLHWYLAGADRYRALALLSLVSHCISEECFSE